MEGLGQQVHCPWENVNGMKIKPYHGGQAVPLMTALPGVGVKVVLVIRGPMILPVSAFGLGKTTLIVRMTNQEAVTVLSPLMEHLVVQIFVDHGINESIPKSRQGIFDSWKIKKLPKNF